jgi:hypothetical protein
MPLRSIDVRCRCTECLATDPNGKVFAASRIKGHLASVQAQRVRDAEVHEDLESANAQLLALVLTDEGPNLATQPSPLWTSRDHFQGMHDPPILQPSSSPGLDDIIKAVNNLSISQDHVRSNSSHSDMPTPPSSQPDASGHVRHGCMSKKERSRHTTKVLDQLVAIESRIALSRDNLINMPSKESFTSIMDDVSSLRCLVDSIKRRTPTIDQRKGVISQQLDKLEASVTELRQLAPYMSEGPIFYDCSE